MVSEVSPHQETLWIVIIDYFRLVCGLDILPHVTRFIPFSARPRFLNQRSVREDLKYLHQSVLARVEYGNY